MLLGIMLSATLFGIGVSCVVSYQMLESYKLNTCSKYDGCEMKDFNPNDHLPIEELKQQIDYQRIKLLLPYLKKLESSTDEENLTSAYANLRDVVVKHKLILFFSGCYGSYNQIKNQIDYLSKKALGHEFLHMASSNEKSDKNMIETGFYLAQKDTQNKVTSIGYGLNEGYTELLASRLFYNGKITAYKTEVQMALLFELFFDNTKEMQDLYLFIKHMENFAPRKEIIKTILYIDIINDPSVLNITHLITSKVKVIKSFHSWFMETNPSLEKQKQFHEIIKEDPFMKFVLQNQSTKLIDKKEKLKEAPKVKQKELI